MYAILNDRICRSRSRYRLRCVCFFYPHGWPLFCCCRCREYIVLQHARALAGSTARLFSRSSVRRQDAGDLDGVACFVLIDIVVGAVFGGPSQILGPQPPTASRCTALVIKARSEMRSPGALDRRRSIASRLYGEGCTRNTPHALLYYIMIKSR